MNPTIKYLAILLLCALPGVGCEEKVVYEDSLEAGSIQVSNITDNTLRVYTGETFRIEMSVLPPEAKSAEQIKYAYVSGNEQIFTVSSDGVVSGVKPGEAVLRIEAVNRDGMKTAVMVSVTNKLYPVTEIKIDERLKNLTLAVGDEIQLDGYIKVLPENASNKAYTLESSNGQTLAVTESGSVKALALGNATLTVKAKDGSGITATCKISIKEPVYKAIDRSAWTVIPSHNLPADAAISNAPGSLIDGNISTCLSMVKPGKSYAGISVGADEAVFFVVDMKAKTKFNYFKISHRTSNPQLYLRIWGVSLFGSDDNKTFTPIRENIPIGYDGVNDHTVRMLNESDYRYLKVQYTDWSKQSGSAIQIAEFELGLFGF
jgi:uncharacterized protein YjdB